MKNKNNYYIHSKLLPLHKISLQIVIPEERHLYFPIFFITLRLKEVVIVQVEDFYLCK